VTNFVIRPARPEDAARISTLAQRSKAHWGYDEEYLAAFRSELILRPDQVVPKRTQVAVSAPEVGGPGVGEPAVGGPGAGGLGVGEPAVGGPGEAERGEGGPERILGFATLEGEAPGGELGMLFVDPEVIGQGVGTALFQHISTLATQLGFHRLTIAADPFAEPFYLAQGAVRIGAVPSGAIPGRSLPLLSYAL